MNAPVTAFDLFDAAMARELVLEVAAISRFVYLPKPVVVHVQQVQMAEPAQKVRQWMMPPSQLHPTLRSPFPMNPNSIAPVISMQTLLISVTLFYW